MICESVKEYFESNQKQKKQMKDMILKYPLMKDESETYTCPVTGVIRRKKDLAEDLEN